MSPRVVDLGLLSCVSRRKWSGSKFGSTAVARTLLLLAGYKRGVLCWLGGLGNR